MRSAGRDHIELIASENYTSPRVLEAQGSVLTNKYAEGYPGRRYYGGCEYVDIVEQLAIDRAKQLFGAAYANVQPHSGSQANAAAYFALVQPGDTILGMSLDHGGHLTHGAKVNFSGKFYQRRAVRRAQGRPADRLRQVSARRAGRAQVDDRRRSAYSASLTWRGSREIAAASERYLLVDMAHVAGLVATGLHPNPIPHADVVTTTTHKTLRGPRGGLILARQNDAIAKRLNSLVFPGNRAARSMHVIAAKAVGCSRRCNPVSRNTSNKCSPITRHVRALMARGLRIVSGGTDNHLFLRRSAQERRITGKDADAALGRANITVNKNAVPNDPRPPAIASGLRIGTPASTTRGFKEREIEQVADMYCRGARCGRRPTLRSRACASRLVELCRQFPVYGP